MMNTLLCGLVLALSCAVIDATAAEQSGPAATPPDELAAADVRPSASFQAGPVTITPGGFFELTSIYRTRNETADIGSSFSGAPFPDNNNYKISEFRETVHNSRFSLLAQAPSDRSNQLEGYLETDFVSAGVTSNSNESNSYTLRVRQLFINWTRAARRYPAHQRRPVCHRMGLDSSAAVASREDVRPVARAWHIARRSPERGQRRAPDGCYSGKSRWPSS
jgi:hypothetical protein